MWQAQVTDDNIDRDDQGWYVDDTLEAVLHALAAVYADHPDYREEWQS